MISGATGALAVVMVSLVIEGNTLSPDIEFAGLQYLFATLLLMGAIQILFGVLRLGKFIRLIPHPVMIGFVNGLAIVIFMSQLEMFKVGHDWLSGSSLLIMIGLVVLTMAIMFGLPKLNKKIPAGLTAILVISVIVIAGGVDAQTVKSFVVASGGSADGIKGGLPTFGIPDIPFNFETLKFIFPYALVLAAIGLTESLMTLSLIDEMTETRGNSNKESWAQGLANVVNGFFGGMGGCAMIGQSLINIYSGGRSRLSGIVAALALLSFILFLSSYIGRIPIAALVGIMFMVVIGTFAWTSLRILHKIPLSDAIVIVLVTVVTVWFNLAIAVAAGIVVSALVFAWENARRIRARKSIRADGTKVYEIWGPLFFGSIKEFNNKFTVAKDPQSVEIDFIESRVVDHSAIEAISIIVDKYTAAGKTITLMHLSKDCKATLMKADSKFEQHIVTDINDPRYYVMRDTLADEG